MTFHKPWIIILIIVLFSSGCARLYNPDIKKRTFKKLERIRSRKKAEVIGYFENIHRKAADINNDRVMMDFFTEMRELSIKKARDYYVSKLCKRLSESHKRSSIKAAVNNERINVDINEYEKAVPGQVLETYGVNTCTAVVISKPCEFGYLVHLSPLDDIYHNSALTRFFLRDKKSSVLDSLLKRIGYWNIYRLRRLWRS